MRAGKSYGGGKGERRERKEELKRVQDKEMAKREDRMNGMLEGIEKDERAGEIYGGGKGERRERKEEVKRERDKE